MNNKLTQKITDAINAWYEGPEDGYSFNEGKEAFTNMIILILEQAKSDAQEAIEARMSGHLYASHHDVEIDNTKP